MEVDFIAHLFCDILLHVIRKHDTNISSSEACKGNEFSSVMDEAAKKGRTAAAKCFLWEHGGDIQKIPFKDIWYVESQGHYLQMAYGRQTIQWKSSLGKVQDVFKKNGEHIPVSRNRYKTVNEAFIQYYKNRKE